MDEDEVIQTVRACLLSAKGGVRFDELNPDYQMIIGENIPFQRLGYPSLEAFLRTIHGFKISNKLGVWYAEALPTEDTVHITDLISRQKSPKKQGKSSRYHRPFQQGNRAPTRSFRVTRGIRDNVSSAINKGQIMMKNGMDYRMGKENVIPSLMTFSVKNLAPHQTDRPRYIQSAGITSFPSKRLKDSLASSPTNVNPVKIYPPPAKVRSSINKTAVITSVIKSVINQKPKTVVQGNTIVYKGKVDINERPKISKLISRQRSPNKIAKKSGKSSRYYVPLQQPNRAPTPSFRVTRGIKDNVSSAINKGQIMMKDGMDYKMGKENGIPSLMAISSSPTNVSRVKTHPPPAKLNKAIDKYMSLVSSGINPKSKTVVQGNTIVYKGKVDINERLKIRKLISRQRSPKKIAKTSGKSSRYYAPFQQPNRTPTRSFRVTRGIGDNVSSAINKGQIMMKDGMDYKMGKENGIPSLMALSSSPTNVSTVKIYPQPAKVNKAIDKYMSLVSSGINPKSKTVVQGNTIVYKGKVDINERLKIRKLISRQRSPKKTAKTSGKSSRYYAPFQQPNCTPTRSFRVTRGIGDNVSSAINKGQIMMKDGMDYRMGKENRIPSLMAISVQNLAPHQTDKPRCIQSAGITSAPSKRLKDGLASSTIRVREVKSAINKGQIMMKDGMDNRMAKEKPKKSVKNLAPHQTDKPRYIQSAGITSAPSKRLKDGLASSTIRVREVKSAINKGQIMMKDGMDNRMAKEKPKKSVKNLAPHQTVKPRCIQSAGITSSPSKRLKDGLASSTIRVREVKSANNKGQIMMKDGMDNKMPKEKPKKSVKNLAPHQTDKPRCIQSAGITSSPSKRLKDGLASSTIRVREVKSAINKGQIMMKDGMDNKMAKEKPKKSVKNLAPHQTDKPRCIQSAGITSSPSKRLKDRLASSTITVRKVKSAINKGQIMMKDGMDNKMAKEKPKKSVKNLAPHQTDKPRCIQSAGITSAPSKILKDRLASSTIRVQKVKKIIEQTCLA